MGDVYNIKGEAIGTVMAVSGSAATIQIDNAYLGYIQTGIMVLYQNGKWTGYQKVSISGNVVTAKLAGYYATFNVNNPYAIAGLSSIPTWAYIAAGGAAILLLFLGRGK